MSRSNSEKKPNHEGKEAKEMSFLDHLEELRWHLIRAFASILVFSIIAFLNEKIVFGGIILAPSRADFWTYQLLCQISDAICIKELPFIIQNRVLTGQFTMHIAASFAVGIVCAFPYTFWELWRFVKPALYVSEKQTIRGTTFFVSLLFGIGVLFGYFIITPLSINFLSNYQIDPSIVNEIDIHSYVTTVAMLTIACGLMFQLPMVAFALSKVGLATPALMRHFRRHAIVIILIISAIITPPDVVSQVIISLPIFALYEGSILISAWVERQRIRQLAAQKQAEIEIRASENQETEG
ncbi:twin-arginine translocase subunit TatC [Hugenholtzia roseola]|uniref:twin-arginine translocase subunit TatC n=1 Tax=Hugenholtzia roseola TaxID=1002 RepID=UPI00040A700E|nr:twin-arginine translocase subunit TatC [Hugenholtzia roseola]